MKEIRVAEGIVPIEEAASDLDRLVRLAASTREPVVLTKAGRAVCVLLSPVTFDEMRSLAADEELTRQAMQSVADGDFVDGEVVEAWLKSWGTADELPPPR